MKKLFTTAACLALLFSCDSIKSSTSSEFKSQKPANVNDYASSITLDDLKEDLYIYASDKFEGRETGKPGQKKAVEFIKAHYQNLDIASPISKNDYFQEVPLKVINTPDVDFNVNGKKFTYFDDFISIAPSNSETLDINELIFVGYGIDTDSYSDFKNLDVKGKVVVAKNGEPKNEDGTYTVSGTNETSKWSNVRQELASKRDAAKDKGAKAFVFISPELFKSYSGYFKRQSESGGSGRLYLEGDDNPMHFFMCNENLGEALVANYKNKNTSETLKTTLKLNYANKSDDMQSENVAAFIKGTEKPNEVIVISAHLDHEGIKDGKVYNGADDDGSGTVAVMQIAKAFQKAVKAGHGPKRSILFLHVTGEEKGLLGSRHYTDNDPIIPLANTVANLNIDMIGRTDPKRENDNRNYVYLIGSDKLSTELHEVSEAVNKDCCNIELDYTFNDDNDPNRFYYRSDHYNFAKNNIPVIFYFNGTHDDYHQPSDTPDKIQYDLLENRTRLVFYTAWELANRDQRVAVDKPTK